jgi:hypothetical protein
METRSRPARPLAVSVKAVSDWMPSETAGLKGLPKVLGGFMTMVLLSIRVSEEQWLVMSG